VDFLWRTGVRNYLYLNFACKSKINLEVASLIRIFSVIYLVFICCAVWEKEDGTDGCMFGCYAYG
jgi:hypothetical protein